MISGVENRSVSLALALLCCCTCVIAAENDREQFHAVRGRSAKPFVEGRVEGERLLAGGHARPQDMRLFGEQWSQHGQLLWDGAVGDAPQATFNLEHAGLYSVSIQLTMAPDYGRFDVFLNDQPVATSVDLFDPRVTLATLVQSESVKLHAGEQKLEFKLVGKNPAAKTFGGNHLLFGIDFIDVKVLEIDGPPQTADVETASAVLDTTPLQPKQFNATLGTYCLDCHTGADAEGGVELDKFTSHEAKLADIKTTQRIRNVLQRHEMPPKDEKQPDRNIRARLVASLNTVIDEYLKTHHAETPVVMRRMTRYEYSNSVRDLLNLKGDIYPLPEKTIRADTPYFDPASGRFPDVVTVGNRTLGKNQVEKQVLTGVTPFAIDLQAEGGFNNRGSQLSVSPILLESFLNLGRSIVNAPEFDEYCLDTSSLFLAPDDATAVQQIELAKNRLQSLLERAFRSPVEDRLLNRYHDFFKREFANSKSFGHSMKSVMAAVLASPRFIYLSEVQATEPGLNAWELATRLSFFLWSTIPDEELLATARDGSLLRPEVLDAQVERMLEHPRSQALSQNFARQWLRLDQVITAVPDFERFERYYARIGCEQWKLGLQSMIEPLLLFESIMVEDRSIMLLIDSDYTYRSNELQSWYREEVPFGGKANRERFNTNQQQFRRIKLEDRREGGVITSAATLTMTSAPLRTSPIVRGAWVATVVFNQPPPPPPDDVPSIEADDKAIEAKGQTLRERLVEHQENQSCASCHSKIDPLGFALENYDAVGRWRDTYRSGLPIDSSGKLFGEAEFNDVIELKDALLERPDWFMRAFCEHMLSYALTRELDVADELAVDNILAKAMVDQGQFSTIVREVVRSHPFRHQATAAHAMNGEKE